ncbi:MAG TPA: alpha/beta hydrolase [Telluria sp.]|nr:alpha/beta hydrolase [Telluria sp.]
MPNLTSNGINIAYETAGDPKGVPMLLVAGLGLQLISWPDDFVDGLVELGFHVIRFDNRDCGLSTKFMRAGTSSLPLAMIKSMLRLPVRSAYRLDDMAADALGVLNGLGIAKAHVVGLSMGGMIAQILTARHPDRVLSLTSIMSSSGRRGLPGPTRAARAAVTRRRPDLNDTARLVTQFVDIFRIIGSPSYPTPERLMRERVEAAIARNVCSSGVARQLMAMIASGDRCALLRSIDRPTLVIHGAADPLVPLACGVDTARLVPGARLEVIEGMGHDLPAQLVERLLALIDVHARGKMAADTLPRLFEKQ